MKKATVLFVSLITASALMCGCSSQQNSAERYDRASFDGYEKVPMHASWSYNYGGIAELTNSSDLIARVKVVGESADDAGSTVIGKTVFTAEVEELIYGDNENSVNIVMTGWIDHNGKKIHEIDDDPLMYMDDEFLIFARKNDSGRYTILGGPQGRYVIDDGQVYSLGSYTSKLSRSGEDFEKITGENYDDFISGIRSHII